MSSSAPAAAWFLYNIWHLSNADFGEYRTLLFIGFAAVAILAFRCVPDFLGVRGACALVLIGSAPLLHAAYMEYGHPTRLFMVVFVYVAIALASGSGRSPGGFAISSAGSSRAPRVPQGPGRALVAYGFLLSGVAFTMR